MTICTMVPAAEVSALYLVSILLQVCCCAIHTPVPIICVCTPFRLLYKLSTDDAVHTDRF